jgi:hypothetical protein
MADGASRGYHGAPALTEHVPLRLPRPIGVVVALVSAPGVAGIYAKGVTGCGGLRG